MLAMVKRETTEMKHEMKLCAIYGRWLIVNGYPAMCAEELLCEPIVTNKEHRRWLARFITAWERAAA